MLRTLFSLFVVVAGALFSYGQAVNLNTSFGSSAMGIGEIAIEPLPPYGGGSGGGSGEDDTPNDPDKINVFVHYPGGPNSAAVLRIHGSLNEDRIRITPSFINPTITVEFEQRIGSQVIEAGELVFDQTESMLIDADLFGGNDRFDGTYTGVRMNVNGGAGNDTLIGGFRNNVLKGGAGHDDIQGEGFTSYIDGGTGNDFIRCEGAGNVVFGGDGHDVIYGSGSADEITCGSGDDFVMAGSSDDIIKGNDGRDILYGEGGDDSMDGGSGYDQMYGGRGADYMNGSFDGHWDRLEGGPEGDTFVTHQPVPGNLEWEWVPDFSSPEGDRNVTHWHWCFWYAGGFER